MSFHSKSVLDAFYEQGMSMTEIAKRQKVSLHKVAYWMKNYQIQSRTRSEASYIKRNPQGNPFQIRITNSRQSRDLLALGSALYLGEGTKSGHGVRFTNSDSAIVKLFLAFLIEICGVKIEKVRAWINLFDDIDYNETLNFWLQKTNIPKKNFFKPIIRKRKKGTYKNKNKYGTITILVDNSRLKIQINSWCSEYLRKYAEVAQW